MKPIDIQRVTAIADSFSLLGITTQYPTQELAKAWCDGGVARDMQSIAAEAGMTFTAHPDVTAGGIDAKQELELLRREYTRLFNHPEHPAVQLYEGQFLYFETGQATGQTDNRLRPRLFVNPAALDAEREMRAAGIAGVEGVNVPADAMYVQMEFMAYLFGQKARRVLGGADQSEVDARIEEYCHYHLDKWMAGFYRACCENSVHALYRMAGTFGLALYETLTLLR